MTPWLLIACSLAAAEPGVEVSTPAGPSSEPVQESLTQSPELSPEAARALENYELLIQMDMLSDMHVAQYLDVLRLEED